MPRCPSRVAPRSGFARPAISGTGVVRDGAYELIPAADTYLRVLRYSRGRALGTTEKYAGNLAVFFDWCARRRLDLVGAAADGRVRVGVAQRAGDASGQRCWSSAERGADQSHPGVGAGDVPLGGCARRGR